MALERVEFVPHGDVPAQAVAAGVAGCLAVVLKDPLVLIAPLWPKLAVLLVLMPVFLALSSRLCTCAARCCTCRHRRWLACCRGAPSAGAATTARAWPAVEAAAVCTGLHASGTAQIDDRGHQGEICRLIRRIGPNGRAIRLSRASTSRLSR
jgi:hypothetical protein